ESQTPLHIASSRGHIECVRGLINAGACVDPQDNQGSTPLHLALRRHHVQTALILLHAGANTDLTEESGEAPIHIAAREGLLALAQTLCAFGCSVDQPNRNGLYPLHLAAKNGHTEVVRLVSFLKLLELLLEIPNSYLSVLIINMHSPLLSRCLCLAGCLVEQKSRDGILAEVSAMAQGYEDIAELLNRLRNEQQKEEYIQQLIPTGAYLPRIKVKLLGHSGAGKSALADSLKAGYFTSLFRRSKSVPAPSVNTTNSSNTSNLKSKCDIFFKIYVSISGVGDLSIWDFSGHEGYFSVYDHFIGNSTCVHFIVFSLDVPLHVQLQQTTFWLSFLQARLPPTEPLGLKGKPNKPCKVSLVATHADLAQCHKNNQGEYVAPQTSLLQEKLISLYGDIFELHDSIFVVEATSPGSPGIKAMKSYLANMKTKLTQDVPRVTGFLNAMVALLPELRSSLSDFPVISWPQFIDIVHERVNCLAGDEHLKEIVTQLQLLGEIIYLKAAAQDLVILDPPWLTSKQIGLLLSKEYSLHARVTGAQIILQVILHLCLSLGCYTVDDFQMSFPDCDALDLLQVLEALHLCTQCDNEGEIEYEFPCFNKVETLDGLWDPTDPRYEDGVYAGVRLKSPAPTQHLLPPIYTRIQVQLRRSWQEYPECDTDLYQWYKGSKFCSGPLEALITLEEDGEAVEVKVRGPPKASSVVFFFMEDLLAMVDQVMVEMCPGLVLEKHIMSSEQLKEHTNPIYAWSPADVFAGLMADGVSCKLKNPLTKREESFSQLICLGSQEVLNSITTGRDIHISSLCTVSFQKLSSLLDPPHPRGSDWCVLAVKLGLQNLLPTLDATNSNSNASTVVAKLSPTASLLNSWGESPKSTVGKGIFTLPLYVSLRVKDIYTGILKLFSGCALIVILREMEREDAVLALYTSSPLYILSSQQSEETSPTDTPPISTASATSTSNLSR
ncbi:Death-associated protein kinase dapk-1, partial [Armadillidium nasatum]